MVGGARALGPVIFAVALGNRQIVDAGKASAHQAVLIEFPTDPCEQKAADTELPPTSLIMIG